MGDGTGHVSRRADETERVQLGMAGDLLGHAAELLAERGVSDEELRYLATCLADCLLEVTRVAESRGARLATGASG